MNLKDPIIAEYHRKFYWQFFNELDNDIAQEVINEPYGDEAILLNKKTESAVRKALGMPEETI
jgi:hypothetical protein